MSIDPQKIKKEIEGLKAEILAHEHSYYILDDPKISDSEFDRLMKKLEELERRYPQFSTADSPAKRVGGKSSPGAKAVRHAVPMLSLENTYSPEEIKEWDKRCKKTLPEERFVYIVEPKIDGVSCSIIYEDGLFAAALSRGDGHTGEDVTANVRTLRTVPLKLKGPAPQIIEVRGEIFMDKKDFSKLNEARKRSALDVFANPRNAASGSLKLLDTSETAERRLKFIPHSFGRYEGKEKISDHAGFYDFLRSAGFKIIDRWRLCRNIEEVLDYCAEAETKRNELPYETDGMVVKINDYRQRSLLGETTKSPRWAVAYKFEAQQATTVVEKINFQVGRTGAITPVALLKPVECAGVTISRATLHNFDEVQRLGVGEGDTVLIERAGDVIPKVIKVTRKAPFSERVKPPLRCPECGSEVVKESLDDVAYVCPNPLCPAQIIRAIIHFGSRAAMDIEGLGSSAVEQLVQKGFVRKISDIYSLDKETLLKLELFKDKKAENLLESIEKSKSAPLRRFIYALGIRNVGEKAAGVIAEEFKSLEKILNADEGELTGIKDIGPVIARSVCGFFKNPGNRDIVKKLIDSGVTASAEPARIKGQKLTGKKFVFTGELQSMSRTEASAKVAQLGGEAVSSVSTKTDFVVAGENPGSKYQKAVGLNVTVLTEKEFLELIN